MDTRNFIVQFNNLDPQCLNESIVEIPNVSRLDLIKWVRMLDFKVGAELGVAYAEYSKDICDINFQMKLYGIDSWAPYKGYKDFTKQSTFSRMEEEARHRMKVYIQRDRYEIRKGFSMDVVSQFEDNFFDFLYIDANHQDPWVTQDINAWSKKVRSGGIVAGHDYVKVKRVNGDEFAVKEAIQKYTKENNIKGQ